MTGCDDIAVRLTAITNELIASGITLEQATKAFRDNMLVTALERAHWNATKAAKMLGVHRNTVGSRRPPTERSLRLRAARAVANARRRKGTRA